MAKTSDEVLRRIFAEYSPYDAMPAFREGYQAYQLDGHARRNPHADGVAAQAWDRGANAAMLYQRAMAHLDTRPSDDEPDMPGNDWLDRLIKSGRC